MYDNNRNSIAARLYYFDNQGVQIGEAGIPAGGVDLDPVPGAVAFVIAAPGFQDAHLNDLYSWESLTWELIPRYRWVVPAVVGAAALYILVKYVKF